MTKELFKKFVEHKLDEIDVQRVAVEAYAKTKEVCREMDRMCNALADYCEENKFALQMAQVSLVIQGYFPGMDKDDPENVGTVGFIWGSARSIDNNISRIIQTHAQSEGRRIMED